MMTALSETDLLHVFVERTPFALPMVRVFRRNIINRSVEVEGRRIQLRNGIKGQCDAYAIVRGGRHIELETKAAKGTMRKAQLAWRAWCLEWGIPHLVLRAAPFEKPDETVARWIEELRGALAT